MSILDHYTIFLMTPYTRATSRRQGPTSLTDEKSSFGDQENDDKQSKSIMPRPIPEKASFWHKENVSCVKITLDGLFVASAGGDHRIIISDLSSGKVRYHINTWPHLVKAMVWLGKGEHGRRLVAGYDNGMIISWSLAQKGTFKKEFTCRYPTSISLLDYDLASDRILLAQEKTCSVLNLKKPSEFISEGFDCEGTIGGLGFLAFGSRCLVSVPRTRHLLFLSLQADHLTLESRFPVKYEPNFLTVSNDSISFAVGGQDGTIHVYNWMHHPSPFEVAVVHYPRIYQSPRSITFSFLNGSQIILVGSEEENAFLYDVMRSRKIAELSLQGKSPS